MIERIFYMKLNPQNISSESYFRFYSASQATRQSLLHIKCIGHFFCKENYCVSNTNSKGFFLVYVKSGECCTFINKKTETIKQGSFIYLNCYDSYLLYTYTGCEIYWIFFDGVTAKSYYDMAVKDTHIFTLPFADNQITFSSLYKIYELFTSNQIIIDVLVSKHITDLLTSLILYTQNDLHTVRNHTLDSTIRMSIKYIYNNLSNDITLKDLANIASFSPYYFLRIFKKYTGCSPHEYIVQARISLAKHYLSTTNIDIKDISIKCGYNNVSSFCTSFKKIVGLTARDFRQLAH